MNEPMQIPDEACRYILFQRTAYLVLTKTLAFRAARKLVPGLTYERTVALESRLRRDRIKALFDSDMREEYLSIRDHLPAKCGAVLDIGCGVAGIDVFLSRHYRAERPKFLLLDKTHVEKEVYYNFKPSGAFYNSLAIAKRLLTCNGVAEAKVRLIEVGDGGPVPIEPGIDLVISLISWCFHYPVDTYLRTVHEALNPQGSLIVDVRRNTDGIAKLQSTFRSLRVIRDYDKYQRVLAIK
jgi:SAM-dependent methyltransferase